MNTSNRQRVSVAGDARRRRHLRRRIASACARIVFAVTLLVVAPVRGVTSTTVTIDGAFGDWAAPFSDPANMMGDTVAPNDPDNPNPAQNRDLVLAGYTYDATNAYFYMRRTTAGNNQVDYRVYIDVDRDGVLRNNEFVLVYAFNGAAYNAGNSGLFRYSPANATGDPVLGDGHSMPGTVGGAVAGAVFTAAGSPAGIEIEGSVRWSSLGLPTGAPLALKFAASRGGIDNTGILDTTRRSVTLVPDRAQGGTAGSTVVYTHTVTNTGNATETVLLEAVSSRGWTTEVQNASGSALLPSITLGPGASRDITVRVSVPPGVADGTRDVTTVRATLSSDASVSAVARDTTTIGPILVIPNREGSMAPGQQAHYLHTVTNNTDMTRTVSLTASSDRGWVTAVLAGDGVSRLETATLAPGASAPVVVRVSVPATATPGLLDVTTLGATDVSDPLARGAATASTRVRAALTAEPNRTTASGPGTIVWFEHTITNSWPSTRTVSLSAANNGGWSVAVYNQAKSATTASVVLGPQGGSATVQVRVTIPAAAAEGVATTTTLTATAPAGSHTATATGAAVVRRLTTYADAGYASRSADFRLGETVYARAGGLGSNQQVTFRWLAPDGTIMHTSNTVTADTQGSAVSFYSLPPAAPVGEWTLLLRNNAGATITSTTFTVSYNGTISALTATDADPAGRPTTITASVRNEANGPLAASTLRYLVWFDANANGVFDAGDTWADASGEGQSYSSPDDATRVWAVPALPAGATLADTPWSLPSVDLPFAGTWRVTATWIAADDHVIDVRSTAFSVKLATFAMGISAKSIDFGAVDPGTDHDSGPVTVTINASEPFDFTTSVSGGLSTLGLTSQLGDRLNQPSGPSTFIDRFRISVPWTADPGPYMATVVYTIVPR